MSDYYGGNGYLYIKEANLGEVIKFSSKKTVGKVLKRFEIHQNVAVLKSEIKELLYESFRDLEDLLVASGKGMGLTTFEFKSKGENRSTK